MTSPKEKKFKNEDRTVEFIEAVRQKSILYAQRTLQKTAYKAKAWDELAIEFELAGKNLKFFIVFNVVNNLDGDAAAKFWRNLADA